MFARSELGIGARLMFADPEPFSAGAFTDFYYGSKLLDDSKRNGITWDLGVAASLTALEHVTISGRLYLDIWSDRHCPVEATTGATSTDGFDGTAGVNDNGQSEGDTFTQNAQDQSTA